MLSADNATAWQLLKEIFLLSKREKNWETAAKHNFFGKKSFKKSIFETPSKGFCGGPVLKNLHASGGTSLMPGWEDARCCGATKPVATTTEPVL